MSESNWIVGAVIVFLGCCVSPISIFMFGFYIGRRNSQRSKTPKSVVALRRVGNLAIEDPIANPGEADQSL